MEKQLRQSQCISGIGQNIFQSVSNDFERIKVLEGNAINVEKGSDPVSFSYKVCLETSNQEKWTVTLTLNENRTTGPLIETVCERHEHVTSQMQSLCSCVPQILKIQSQFFSLLNKYTKGKNLVLTCFYPNAFM